MEQEISCKKCGLVNDYQTEMKGGQMLAYCNGCESYIKNIPQHPPTFFVGKYKDHEVPSMTDIGYLVWWRDTVAKQSRRLRAAVVDRIKELEADNG